MSRIVCQFSCGAASAVATKIALTQYKDQCVIVNAYIKEEHEDNQRFANDCEKWFGQEIVQLRDTKYNASTIEVFETALYIKGRHGASCTARLKRGLLKAFEQPGDILVMGYTTEEKWRLDDWMENWPNRPILTPLIEYGLTKENCKAMVKRAGIELPMMYRMGYHNANCIGCVKGGQGYFRAIREDFPDQFERLCQAEDKVASVHGDNARILLHRSGPLKGQRFALRDLSEGKARRNEELPNCGFVCDIVEYEYSG